MRHIIKLSIVALILIIASKSFTQTFGIKTGFNLSEFNLRTDETIDFSYNEIKLKPGFHVGPTVEFKISELFSIETGLLLNTKGQIAVLETGEGEGLTTTKGFTNLLYLDIPLTAKISFDVKRIKIYADFGPYGGVALHGKFKIEVSTKLNTSKYEVELEFGSDETKYSYKRFDYGLIAGVGVEIYSFQIGFSYSLGLADISTNSHYNLKNRVLGISVSYKIRKK